MKCYVCTQHKLTLFGAPGIRPTTNDEARAAAQEKYDAHAPRAGDPAPDFELSDVTGEQRVRLSDFQGQKPVALIFGSFT